MSKKQFAASYEQICFHEWVKSRLLFRNSLATLKRADCGNLRTLNLNLNAPVLIMLNTILHHKYQPVVYCFKCKRAFFATNTRQMQQLALVVQLYIVHMIITH